ncbi:MAG: glycosyltransferase family 2 protein [SAR324 cluster bacterium]|nr:glycosyltransferase family 2 protein [SAR324 cluster bacterium]
MMNVIIPMSGIGKRFIEAGYTEPKPLIEVEGKPIIQHIVERFSPEDHFIFICNQDHLRETPMMDVLRSIAPQGDIIGIAPHKLGPVHAVMQVKERIDDDQPCIVNYCDFSWRWDYADFKSTVMVNHCDGCVVCYKGFHPHLLGPNFYASLRDDGNNWGLEIREKYSFTPDKMDSFQSSGTYYFRTGNIMKKAFQECMDQRLSLGGEYYVSLVYQSLFAHQMPVYIYEIPFFLQWGTPQDLAEYLYWSKYFHAKNKT